MKKLLSLALSLAIGLTTLVGCGGNSGKTKIIVGTMAEPGQPILEAIRDDFEAKGYELELQIFNSFDLVNPPLANGSIHANLFQHEPYLNTYNADNNEDLVVAKKLYLPVYGIYSKKYKTLEEIPNGAQIAVPADASNLSRSLKILASCV